MSKNMKGNVAGLIFLFFFLLAGPLPAVEKQGVSQEERLTLRWLEYKACMEGQVHLIIKLNVPDIQALTAQSIRHGTVKPGQKEQWAGVSADVNLRRKIRSITGAVLQTLSAADYQGYQLYHSIPYMALSVNSSGLEKLLHSPQVISISEDQLIKLEDPVIGQVPGGKKQVPKAGHDIQSLTNTTTLIGADDAWGMGYTGEGWYVAILDTGIRKTHQFFNGKSIVEACYANGETPGDAAGDCPNGLTTTTGEGSAVHYASTYSGYDHGTHVSGIAAGNNGSLFGVAKMANIIAVQVFSRFSAASCGGTACVMSWNSDTLAALDYIYSIRGSYSIAAINVSLGGGGYSSPCDSDGRKAAIDNLRSAGIATCIASGNNGYCGYISSPACTSTAIAVGATTDADEESNFNNWHATMLKIFAPGSGIYSSTGASDSSYASWSGTSMATPHVTGTWALIRHAHSDASVTNALNALKATGVSITSVCDDYQTPISRLHAGNAISEFDNPVLRLAAPNGSESWTIGDSHKIFWSSLNLAGNINLYLYQDAVLVGTIATGIPLAEGSYQWSAGDYQGGAATADSGYSIMIQTEDTAYSDAGDSVFTLVAPPPPSITLTAPNGGESWIIGDNRMISWTSVSLSGNVNLYLYRNGSLLGTIVSGLNVTNGSYSWIAGNYSGGVAGGGSGYVVKIETADSQTSDSSDNSFTLIAPSVSIVSPNGGESWSIGLNRSIIWIYSNLGGNVNIYLYRNGIIVGVIAQNVSITNKSYTWMTGRLTSGWAAPASGYQVRIRTADTRYSDFSNSNFTLMGGSVLIVLTPNNRTSWRLGTSQAITWTSAGLSGYVNIFLYRNGVQVGKIANSIPIGRGYFSWYAGNRISQARVSAASGYYISIKMTNNLKTAWSAGTFTLFK